MLIAKNIRIKEFDLVLLVTALVIAIIGVFTIFSAVYSGARGNDRLWVAQIIRLVAALVAMSIALFIDYRILHGFSYIFYAVWFVLLAFLLTFPEQSLRGVRG